jgi:hypothetical protein
VRMKRLIGIPTRTKSSKHWSFAISPGLGWSITCIHGRRSLPGCLPEQACPGDRRVCDVRLAVRHQRSWREANRKWSVWSKDESRGQGLRPLFTSFLILSRLSLHDANSRLSPRLLVTPMRSLNNKSRGVRSLSDPHFIHIQCPIPRPLSNTNCQCNCSLYS